MKARLLVPAAILAGVMFLMARTATAVPAGGRMLVDSTVPAPSEPSAGVPNGPHEVVSVADIILSDANRRKDVPVSAWFPKEPGRYPVIVFCHGAGGAGDSVPALPAFWASHGYVCLAPTFSDSIAMRNGRISGDPGANSRPFAGPDSTMRLIAQPGSWDDNWIDRPRDVSFVLDSLSDLEKRVPELAGKMDTGHIGVSGHSLGAYTSQVVGGAAVTPPDAKTPLSLADPRAKAILALSGMGPGKMGLDERSWANVTLPTMTVTGSLDTAAGGWTPAWRKAAFDLEPAGDKYHIMIEGAHHMSFTGKLAAGGGEVLRGAFDSAAAGRAGDQAAIFACVERTTLAFWDAYLKGNAAALGWLKSDAPSKADNVTLELYRK
jgi:predicted dienelactone hydrolase